MKNNIFFQPISGFELPRFAGMPTFMRLPNVGLSDKKIFEVDIGIIGGRHGMLELPTDQVQGTVQDKLGICLL